MIKRISSLQVLSFTIAVALFTMLFVSSALASGPDNKTCMDKMKANVTKVSDPAEKERWAANIDLWKMKMALKKEPVPADFAKMQVVLDNIKTNTEKITEPAEKERWQANTDLWQNFISQSPTETAKMKESLDSLKANIANVTDAPEKERWQSNNDLWDLAIKS